MDHSDERDMLDMLLIASLVSAQISCATQVRKAPSCAVATAAVLPTF